MAHMATTHPSPQRLAHTITSAFNEQGHTVLSFAEATNIPRTTLRRNLETGAFTVPQVIAIAGALGMLPSALLARAEAPAKTDAS